MKQEYYLDKNADFVIENYQNKKTFASFLTGVAGELAIPIWVFYVNRGQGISSFGVADKDHAIMEFFPANKSYQNVETKGFRTFIKIGDGKEEFLYEPFRRLKDGVTTKMIISPHALTLEEKEENLGLKVRVRYFILPHENIGALVRKVSIVNSHEDRRTLEVLDGMPIMIPYGMNNKVLKEMSQTVSAWARVYGVEEKTAFYRTDVSSEDRTEVRKVEAGNFFISLLKEDQGNKLLPPIVDPEIIFAESTSLEEPSGFIRQDLAEFQGEQMRENRFPSAMGALKKELGPGQELAFFSVFGYLSGSNRLAEVRNKLERPGYIEVKENTAELLHKYYADHILTVSGEPPLDYYTRQTFIDNFLRGGFPINIGRSDEKIPYYVFSRKHGDLERDYNQFYLAPTFYSHGNGNFRDVIQNRRSDLFFNPQLKGENIKLFASLIQPDGYNPLVIEGSKYCLSDQNLQEVLKQVAEEDRKKLATVLAAPFTVGEIVTRIEELGIKTLIEPEDFMVLLLKNADSWTEAKFGEGYWVDHWTYILDLIETYQGLYPEDILRLLFEDQTYTFFDPYVKVQPRRKKYVLTESGPRQYGAIIFDQDKKELIAGRKSFPYLVRTKKGKGEIYCTNLFVKLLTLAINKISTLDAHGVGVEMEADKPGWYDALNGLPGLFGSSTPETMELLRLVKFLQESVEEVILKKPLDFNGVGVNVPWELHEFYQGMRSVIDEWILKRDDFKSWKDACDYRERYREEVFMGFAGREEEISLDELKSLFEKALVKLETAVKRAQNKKTGLFDTYYDNLPTKFVESGEVSPEGLPYIEVSEFGQRALPPFLEGQVRGMKILIEQEKALSLHRSVCNSELFDEFLGMYRVNGDLSGESPDIGRARAFTPGWLENGSIWLHMEYKYLLELLKSGLYDQFYSTIKTALVPYLNPTIYGRSILENSSFILSSLNRDRNNHGRGYIARLSGSTAEYINIWRLISFGAKPFRVKDGHARARLIYAPQPILPGELFTVEPKKVKIQFGPVQNERFTIPAHCYAYRFLGNTLVVYHNSKRGNTYGPNKVRIQRFQLRTNQGEIIEIEGGEVPSPWANDIRDGGIRRIDLYFS